jgi:hypothetical protein
MMQRVADRLDEDPRDLPLTGLAISQNGPFWRGAAALPTEEDWRQNGGSLCSPSRGMATLRDCWRPPGRLTKGRPRQSTPVTVPAG